MWYLAILAANKKHQCSYSTHLVYQSLLSFIFFSFSFSFFFFLNSCYNANLVCSIDTVATVLWFQHLHGICFLFFFLLLLSFLLFSFFSVFLGVISSCQPFYSFFIFYFFIYIKLLVNAINCYNIFTIVDMLFPHRLK